MNINLRLLILLCSSLFFLSFCPQNPGAPQSFNYQAIARDSLGNTLPNRQIALRISILDNGSTGNPVYTEVLPAVTNQFGLFSVAIGTGNAVSGNFSAIDWPAANKWLKVEMDANAGTNYSLMGTSQLLSVPYALYAASSGSSNISTTVSPLGDTMYIGNSFVIVPGASAANACRSDFDDNIPYTLGHPHAGDNPYDVTQYGLPRFILKNYIELDKIDSISRFRSGAGHSYWDSYEACRSMKHYFRPKYSVDWSAIKIFSPVNGVITNSFPEAIGGNQIAISPFGMPAFNIIIFHVNLNPPLAIGDTVWSGQQVGTHTGPQTGSDVAIRVNSPNNTTRLVSYFDVMSDKLFACYITKGIATRDTLIIPALDRDNDPLLPCNGNQFFYQGTIPNWVPLH